MKNLGNMLKQAQELQTRMAEMQAKLSDVELDGSAGGGMVTVTLNGKGEMRRVKIDRTLASPMKSRCSRISWSRHSMTPRQRSRRTSRKRWAS